MPDYEWKLCKKKPVIVQFRDAVPGEVIETIEGAKIKLDENHLVMKGVRGELYPITKQIFTDSHTIIIDEVDDLSSDTLKKISVMLDKHHTWHGGLGEHAMVRHCYCGYEYTEDKRWMDKMYACSFYSRLNDFCSKKKEHIPNCFSCTINETKVQKSDTCGRSCPGFVPFSFSGECISVGNCMIDKPAPNIPPPVRQLTVKASVAVAQAEDGNAESGNAGKTDKPLDDTKKVPSLLPRIAMTHAEDMPAMPRPTETVGAESPLVSKTGKQQAGDPCEGCSNKDGNRCNEPGVGNKYRFDKRNFPDLPCAKFSPDNTCVCGHDRSLHGFTTAGISFCICGEPHEFNRCEHDWRYVTNYLGASLVKICKTCNVLIKYPKAKEQ